MYCTFRGFLVALLATALTASATLETSAASAASAASGSRDARPAPGRDHQVFTQGEALAVLARAEGRLQRDNQRLRARRAVGHGASTELTLTLRDLLLARSALSGADRRAADAILSRARASSSGAADPNTGSGATPATRCSVNFCVHYRPVPTTGSASGSTTSTQVQATLSVLEHVRAYETQVLGYRPPVSDAPAAASADNPDGRFDVFLRDLAPQGLYGYCSPDAEVPAPSGRAAAYCVLDNDYSYRDYGAAPANSLRATAAHEFFHTIQFAYDAYEDVWFMEGTATWVEDEVYDSINDNYQYLSDSAIRQPSRALDYSIGMHRYGTFLFFKYAAERVRDRNVVRQFWEAADAPRRRYSLQAIRAVIAARGFSWASFYSVFGSWNSLPGLTYSEGTSYPSPAFALSRTLSTHTRRTRTTGWRSVSLPHLSSSAIRVLPAARLSPRKRLLVEVNAPDTARGGTALIQRRYRNGTVGQSLMALNGAGNGRLLLRFDRRALASVAVVLSNTSTTMRDCGRVGDSSGGPLYSCYGRGYFDQGQIFSARASLR